MVTCECGCGQPVGVYATTAKDHRKGESRRFIRGHNRPHRRTPPPEERFWAKVDRRSDEECWLWQGATRGYGHGCLWVDGSMVVASRFAYELAQGPIPAGLYVLHRCDTPPCCNPAHLFVGDQAANAQDMVAKGRSLRGESHNNAKLTEQEVHAIRARATGRHGEASELGREYGVSGANIGYIVRRETWAHV